MKKVVVSGTPYEQGVQEGKAFQKLIHQNVQLVREDLEKSHLNMDKYNELTRQNAEFIRTAQPEQWDEMTGIAAGAELPMEDILLINVPTYFLKNCLGQECSMVLARGNATADGCTYLVKNRDMGIQIQQVMVEYHYADGTSIAEVGGAGIVTYPALGVNSMGLTVTSTGFWSPKVEVHMEDAASRNIFVNMHHLLRTCATTQDVLTCLDSYPRMNGLNLIAADESSAVLVETTRDDYLVERSEERRVGKGPTNGAFSTAPTTICWATTRP